MKILFVIDVLNTGGAERIMTSLANQFAQDNHEVGLAYYTKLNGFYYPIDDKIMQFEMYKNYEKDNRIKRLLNMPIVVRNLSRTICSFSPDVVVSFYTRMSAMSILTTMNKNIPVIISERDAFFLSDTNINKFLRKYLYPKAQGAIYQTKYAQEWLHEKYSLTCPYIITPNPLWLKEFPLKKQIKSKKQIVSVGRLAYQKNHEGLIKAFAKFNKEFPEYNLTIYGEGPERKKLEDLIRGLKLEERIMLPGNVRNIEKKLADADIFVLFSRGEGYPNALLEAMAIGLPVISTDCPVGGPAEMIKHGENGILIPVEDEDALVRALEKLTKDEKYKEQISVRAAEVREKNNWNLIYKNINEFVKDISKCN